MRNFILPMFDSDGRKQMRKPGPESSKLYSELKLSDTLQTKLVEMQEAYTD